MPPARLCRRCADASSSSASLALAGPICQSKVAVWGVEGHQSACGGQFCDFVDYIDSSARDHREVDHRAPTRSR